MSAVFLALLLAVMGGASSSPEWAQDASCDELLEQAIAYADSGNYEQLHDKAWTAHECYGHLESLPAQQVLFQAAFALRRMGQLDEAIPLFDRTIDALDVSADTSFARRVHLNRGFAQYMRGNLAEAAKDYSKAFALSAAMSPADRAGLARDVGAVFQRMHDYTSAQEYYERATTWLTKADPDRTEYPDRWINLLSANADLYMMTGEIDEATELLKSSLALRPSSDTDGRLRNYVLLGDAYSLANDSQSAKMYYERGLSLARRTEDPHLRFWAPLQAGLHNLYRGDLGEAQKLLYSAHNRRQGALHADYERELVHHLGMLQERQGNLEEASAFYREAIQLTEEYRASLRATDWSAQAFEKWHLPYQGLTRVLLAKGEVTAAFETITESRSRHLQDLRQRGRLLSQADDNMRAAFDSLSAALGEARDQLEEDPDQLSTIAQISAERARLLDLPPFEAPSTREIQMALAEDNRALVSYFGSNEKFDLSSDSSFVYAFVLTQDTLAAVPLNTTSSALSKKVASVHPIFSEEGATNPFSHDFSLAALADLHDIVFAPIAELIPEDAPLTIVPHGPLFRLPFSALVTDLPDSRDFRDVRYLLHRHAISHITTASLLLEETHATEAEIDVAVFGQSEYGGDDRVDRQVPYRAATLSNLPAVESEVRNVARLFRRSAEFLNSKATPDSFFNTAPFARVVHIAAHAYASGDEGMIFLGDDPSVESDVIRLREISQHLIPSELVILSACNTAVGDASHTEGMQGLQHAFRTAGTRSTLSTLWLADDVASAEIMTSFHRNLRDGMARDRALQMAQRAFLDNAPAHAASPAFWAAPVLYGDPSPMKLAARLNWIGYGLGGLVLLLTFGFFIRRRLLTES